MGGYRMTTVEVLGYGRLRLTLEDGVEGVVDASNQIDGPVFEQARTVEGFAQAYVDDQRGTVAWPGGGDLECEGLHRQVELGIEYLQPVTAVSWRGDLELSDTELFRTV